MTNNNLQMANCKCFLYKSLLMSVVSGRRLDGTRSFTRYFDEFLNDLALALRCDANRWGGNADRCDAMVLSINERRTVAAPSLRRLLDLSRPPLLPNLFVFGHQCHAVGDGPFGVRRQPVDLYYAVNALGRLEGGNRLRQ